MKAIVFDQYGTPDVLRPQDVEKPIAGDGEVLIQVHAVSINDWDWGLLRGDFVNRMLNGWLRPKRRILGSDVAGIVEAVGKNATRWRPGDAVFGDLSGTWGGFAEYVCARETALAAKPAGITFEQAAAIPQAATLAMQGLLDKGNLRAGQRLLINGAGGGVGTFGVQIAKQYGVHATGVDRAEKLDMLRALGFDEVIDYTEVDFTRSGQRYDLILDVKTNRSPFAYARALAPEGTYVTVGGSIPRLLQVLAVWPVLSLFSRKKMRLVALRLNKDLAAIAAMAESGKLTPVLDGTYALREVPEAMRRFGAGKHQGKVVITVLQK